MLSAVRIDLSPIFICEVGCNALAFPIMESHICSFINLPKQTKKSSSSGLTVISDKSVLIERKFFSLL